MPNLYEKYVLPKLIDAACGQPPMTDLRSRYVSQAQGDVLEIGIGSGLNLKHYGPDVRSITGVDPAAELTGNTQHFNWRGDTRGALLGFFGELCGRIHTRNRAHVRSVVL